MQSAVQTKEKGLFWGNIRKGGIVFWWVKQRNADSSLAISGPFEKSPIYRENHGTEI